MASQPQNQKVLRIGIILDGKIVQERLIKAGETVTVGDSAKNTFVLPKTTLPRPDYPLFVAKGQQYFLSFTDDMKGKISTGGAVVGLDKVRQDPTVAKEKDGWRLPLSEQDRGKINIDSFTVLFQFVPAPPQQVVKPIPMDFRPRLLNEDDTILFGFLALFSSLGFVFLIWVWNTEVKELTIEDVDERWTKLIIEPPEQVEIIEQPTEEGPAETTKPEEKKVEEKPSEQKPAGEQKSAEQRRAEAMESVKQKSLLIQTLLTRGDSSSGTAKDLWSDTNDLGQLNDALKGASGVEAVSESTKGLRTGGGGTAEDADIGDIQGAKGGTAAVSEGPAVKVGKVSAEEGDAGDLDTPDAEKVKGVVKRNTGQLKYCYEQELKADPNLAGRVEIEWVVTGGRVTSANVLVNTTGNSQLGTCIVGKIKRWTFPAEIEGEISWPFVFQPAS